MQRIINKLNKGRGYIFENPTRSIEFLTALASFFFSIVFLSNNNSLINQKFYVNFQYIGPYWIWVIMFFTSILQFSTLRGRTLNDDVLSAFLLKVSSLLWFIVAVMFGSDYPPVNTAFFTYGSLSFMCLLAGYEKSHRNTQELLMKKELQDGVS